MAKRYRDLYRILAVGAVFSVATAEFEYLRLSLSISEVTTGGVTEEQFGLPGSYRPYLRVKSVMTSAPLKPRPVL